MDLKKDAVAIWKAGVAAVDSVHLTKSSISCDANNLVISDQSISLATLNHIEIVGAGKAGAGMAEGVLQALSPLPKHISVSGWLNVPGDCVRNLPGIHLHAARPAGINEPTQAGVEGTEEILRRISTLGENDLCIVLISGGGSALLPAPVAGITLSEKLATTRLLASNGAPIDELNVVRSQISRVKGGRLLRHSSASQNIALIISDVVGDPPEIIASGPTVESTHTPEDAINILNRFDPQRERVAESVYNVLEQDNNTKNPLPCSVRNFVIGSNKVALDAAAAAAEQLGYHVVNLHSANEGDASQYGEDLFNKLIELRGRLDSRRWCILAGGETTVQLAATKPPGKGGRNQEVVLSAITAYPAPETWEQLVLLSGGTDGEDGPTNAAGAVADADLVRNMLARNICPEEYLQHNNSYPFFDKLDGLLLTGPTHTNVMDLAVGIAGA